MKENLENTYKRTLIYLFIVVCTLILFLTHLLITIENLERTQREMDSIDTVIDDLKTPQYDRRSYNMDKKSK